MASMHFAQVPHPLLSEPHSITGAPVPEDAVRRAGVVIPSLPQGSLQQPPVSPAAPAELQHATHRTKPTNLTSEQAVGVPVPRSALITAAPPGPSPTHAFEGTTAVSQRAQAEAHARQAVHVHFDAGAYDGRGPHGGHRALSLQDAAVLRSGDVQGAEQWMDCRWRPPPPEALLSRLREHAACAEVGVEPAAPSVPLKPCKADRGSTGCAQSSRAPTSHCSVLISVSHSAGSSDGDAQLAEVRCTVVVGLLLCPPERMHVPHSVV